MLIQNNQKYQKIIKPINKEIHINNPYPLNQDLKQKIKSQKDNYLYLPKIHRNQQKHKIKQQQKQNQKKEKSISNFLNNQPFNPENYVQIYNKSYISAANWLKDYKNIFQILAQKPNQQKNQQNLKILLEFSQNLNKNYLKFLQLTFSLKFRESLQNISYHLMQNKLELLYSYLISTKQFEICYHLLQVLLEEYPQDFQKYFDIQQNLYQIPEAKGDILVQQNKYKEACQEYLKNLLVFEEKTLNYNKNILQKINNNIYNNNKQELPLYLQFIIHTVNLDLQCKENIDNNNINKKSKYNSQKNQELRNLENLAMQINFMDFQKIDLIFLSIFLQLLFKNQQYFSIIKFLNLKIWQKEFIDHQSSFNSQKISIHYKFWFKFYIESLSLVVYTNKMDPIQYKQKLFDTLPMLDPLINLVQKCKLENFQNQRDQNHKEEQNMLNQLNDAVQKHHRFIQDLFEIIENNNNNQIQQQQQNQNQSLRQQKPKSQNTLKKHKSINYNNNKEYNLKMQNLKELNAYQQDLQFLDVQSPNSYNPEKIYKFVKKQQNEYLESKKEKCNSICPLNYQLVMTNLLTIDLEKLQEKQKPEYKKCIYHFKNFFFQYLKIFQISSATQCKSIIKNSKEKEKEKQQKQNQNQNQEKNQEKQQQQQQQNEVFASQNFVNNDYLNKFLNPYKMLVQQEINELFDYLGKIINMVNVFYPKKQNLPEVIENLEFNQDIQIFKFFINKFYSQTFDIQDLILYSSILPQYLALILNKEDLSLKSQQQFYERYNYLIHFLMDKLYKSPDLVNNQKREEALQQISYLRKILIFKKSYNCSNNSYQLQKFEENLINNQLQQDLIHILIEYQFLNMKNDPACFKYPIFYYYRYNYLQFYFKNIRYFKQETVCLIFAYSQLLQVYQVKLKIQEEQKQQQQLLQQNQDQQENKKIKENKIKFKEEFLLPQQLIYICNLDFQNMFQISEKLQSLFNDIIDQFLKFKENQNLLKEMISYNENHNKNLYLHILLKYLEDLIKTSKELEQERNYQQIIKKLEKINKCSKDIHNIGFFKLEVMPDNLKELVKSYKKCEEDLKATSFKKLISSPRKKQNVSNCCSICIEDFNENDNVFQFQCKHVFHTDCIYPIYRQEQLLKCPNCRKEVLQQQNNNDNQQICIIQ